MLNKYILYFKSFFKGHERTVKAKKNIIASVFIKGLSIIVGFLIMRVNLNYLDETKYGIWVTLYAFIAWFAFFEIGLGDGLKNKLAEALANKKYKLAKIYVSTTYAILSIITAVIAIVFFIANYYFLDWTLLLGLEESSMSELTTLASILFGFFFLTFVIKLISVVLYADQRPAIANTFGPIGNLFVLIIMYILTLTTEGSLIYLGWVLSVIPMIVLLMASIYFYSGEYKRIAPSYKYVKFSFAKGLLNLGVKFFLIQISALIMFQSSNFIIALYYGVKEVTPFNFAHKYFSIILMIFTIVVTPFWSAFTEAWTKKDIKWIQKTIKNLFRIWIGAVIVSIFLFLISDIFFEIWVGEEKMKTMVISTKLKLSLIIYFLLFTFGSVFNMFINGVGKLTIQMYSLLIGALMFVPISIFFIKYLHWGIESVVVASIIANFYSPFIAPIQYYKLIKNKANGIWNK